MSAWQRIRFYLQPHAWQYTEMLEGENEVLRNGCEQALLLLGRKRFEDDPEAKVVRALLRGALATNRDKGSE